jgi:protein-S-isoprenylcysteine O-methyltransferase Ste14
MNIIGKTTIHPLLFYTGKVAGYIIWLVSLATICGFTFFHKQTNEGLLLASYVIFAVALFLSIASMFDLGRSTTLGLPLEKTEFKTGGLYRYSRNPMYLGFGLLTIASILFNASLIIFICGLYSLAIYHFIILGEEKFLAKRFGEKYLAYTKKVRRYL